MKKNEKILLILAIVGFVLWLTGIISLLYFAYNYISNLLAFLALASAILGVCLMAPAVTYLICRLMKKYGLLNKKEDKNDINS